MALAYLNEQITTALDDGLSTIGNFIDLKKLLIQYIMTYFIKIEFIGVRGTALNWIKKGTYVQENNIRNFEMLDIHWKTLFVVSHEDLY